MASHPNRLPWEGVLTRVDEPSDKSPSGARGHRVILTREAALEALDGLVGMAVDYRDDWEGHDCRQKIGVIESAWLVKHELKVAGYLFARDFPEVETKLRPGRIKGSMFRGAMGMSYELMDAHVEDMRRKIWTLTKVTFTGAAILLRDKAAYTKTSFGIVDRTELAIAAAGDSGLWIERSWRSRRRAKGSASTGLRMIVVNERESALECTICGDLEGVSRRALENEAALVLLTDRVSREHSDCERFATNPRRAKAERMYKKRMQAELHGAALA